VSEDSGLSESVGEDEMSGRPWVDTKGEEDGEVAAEGVLECLRAERRGGTVMVIADELCLFTNHKL